MGWDCGVGGDTPALLGSRRGEKVLMRATSTSALNTRWEVYLTEKEKEGLYEGKRRRVKMNGL